MLINIVLRIDEELLQEGLERLGKSREEVRQRIIEKLEEDMGETIADNWELFAETKFTVD
jgi:hypothetical protein